MLKQNERSRNGADHPQESEPREPMEPTESREPTEPTAAANAAAEVSALDEREGHLEGNPDEESEDMDVNPKTQHLEPTHETPIDPDAPLDGADLTKTNDASKPNEDMEISIGNDVDNKPQMDEINPD